MQLFFSGEKKASGDGGAAGGVVGAKLDAWDQDEFKSDERVKAVFCTELN